MSKDEKGRYWAGIIYPDSCPEDWQEKMRMSGLEILVSPIHDRDIANPKTGELKKPHRHVIAMWRSTTTRKNAERFFEQFNGPRAILRLESPRGMARYLIHLDDPQKAQYDPDDVIEINDASWTKLAFSEHSDETVATVLDVVANDGISSYYDLLRTCQANEQLFTFVWKQPVFCREVIWSFWHRVADGNGTETKRKTNEKDKKGKDDGD